MTPTPPERNNPGYTPEYKELEAAKEATEACMRLATNEPTADQTVFALRWLAAEVRVMRLERALER